MSYKTRSNYPGICAKSCANRGKKCITCIRYSNFRDINDQDLKESENQK